MIVTYELDSVFIKLNMLSRLNISFPFNAVSVGIGGMVAVFRKLNTAFEELKNLKFIFTCLRLVP